MLLICVLDFLLQSFMNYNIKEDMFLLWIPDIIGNDLFRPSVTDSPSPK